jgi:XRE family transcriptional regulator, regulator of sulfur utilization
MATAPQRFSTGLSMDDLGDRIRQERLRRRISLGELASRSEVSSSMLSDVERGTKVPTVLVLDRIATGLGTSIARLLSEERPSRVVILRRNEQNVARDPSGWERRVLSPVLPKVEFEFMRTTLGPGADAGAFLPHARGSREYVAIERGTLRLTLDGVQHDLFAGDSVYFAGDCIHAFANPDRRQRCEYYLAMDVTGHPDSMQHRAVPRRKRR